MEKSNILAQKVLLFMQTELDRPLQAEDLADAMKLKGKELAAFWSVLDLLEAKALVIKTRYGKYGLPDKMNLLVGRFVANKRGFGFVIDDNNSGDDLFISPSDTLNAMNNDKVVARIHKHNSRDGQRREGEIIRIVERSNQKIVGTFENAKHFGFVIPDDNRLGNDIFIPKGEFNGAKKDDKVLVEITKWPEKRKSAEGRIVQVLGRRGDTGLEILSIIIRHGLAMEFSPETIREAGNVQESITERDMTGRRDLRALPIVTIDGEDAKDLDDAVHLECLSDGVYRLGVHIADVSYYVRENGELDKEACDRGTSVYLADRVLPMLPPRLSNGICSLNDGVDRLTISVIMDINSQGKVLEYNIFPSVINVRARLTYTLVRNMLNSLEAPERTEWSDYVLQLEQMERLARILRERRMRRGAIDFDFPEIKVKLDGDGQPIEIVKRVRSIAESIIEEFMLITNETVAEHMSDIGVPAMFRVHEKPDQEKMVKLNQLLHNFNYPLKKITDIHPGALQNVLTKIIGKPEERIISTVMLRSLKQARYEVENSGHFGLAATHYTHFTSPIRRYPDLIVHRLIRETFIGGEVSAKRRNKLAKLLPQIALHSSERERLAAEAERETVNLKKVEYMERFIGECFNGIINGVTAFGLFVEMENGIEGLVHVSAMDDDYYNYVEEEYALMGKRNRKVYRLGDAVNVKLIGTNREERTIDLVLAVDSNAPPRRRKKKNDWD